jgi:4-hydroxy-tetrahydrodipicolinate synthase
MKTKKLAWDLPGLIVPPLTAFDARGKVDYAAMERQIDYIVEAAKPAAICVAGVEAQEYHFLSETERRELIERCADLVGGRVPIIVGVSHASYRRALELVELAVTVKADAVQLLLPNRPSGGKPSTSELVRYFEAIGREAPLPIVAYVNPGPGTEPSLAQLIEVMKLDYVVAVKESSRNQRYLGLLIKDVEEAGLGHVFATMEVMLPCLELGASGATMPPPGAALCAIMIDAFRRKDYETAIAVHRFASEFPARWVDHGGMVGVMKESMRAIGLDVGTCYPPFGEIAAGDAEAIRSAWHAIDAAFPGRIRYRESARA